MMPVQVKVKQLTPTAQMPTRATDGAACFDVRADITSGGMPTSQSVSPGGSELIHTGLSFEVPPGHVLLVFSRSGAGFHAGVRLANCVGVIDSDYRGELMVKLANDGPFPFLVAHGDRIAQFMIVPLPEVLLTQADDLSETARGQSGLGSTGAA